MSCRSLCKFQGGLTANVKLHFFMVHMEHTDTYKNGHFFQFLSDYQSLVGHRTYNIHCLCIWCTVRRLIPAFWLDYCNSRGGFTDCDRKKKDQGGWYNGVWSETIASQQKNDWKWKVTSLISCSSSRYCWKLENTSVVPKFCAISLSLSDLRSVRYFSNDIVTRRGIRKTPFPPLAHSDQPWPVLWGEKHTEVGTKAKPAFGT